MRSIQSKDSMKKRASRFVVAMILFAQFGLALGCRNTSAGSPPPCPDPSKKTADDIEVMVAMGDYDGVELWLGEIERYCRGIDAMRSSSIDILGLEQWQTSKALWRVPGRRHIREALRLTIG